MKLIGMLDSPYVRRAAICLKLLQLDFELEQISVFSQFDAFRRINPIVKAPTLVFDDGQILMDSTLIIDYAATLAAPHLSAQLNPPAGRLRVARLTGLALAACEKTVQIVYERELRPEEKRHQPWLDRVGMQLLAAYAALESELSMAPLQAHETGIDQAGVSIAVTWAFTQMMLPGSVAPADFPALQAYSARAEQLPAFVSTPAR